MTKEDAPLPEIIMRPVAETEVNDAFRWYEDKSEGLGSEFMRALDAVLASIQRNPTAYAIVYKQMRRALLRRFPYGIIYLVGNNEIIVLGCFHASRNPKQWRNRS